MPKERLQIKAFHMKDVALGKKVKIDNNQLTIPTEIEYDKNVFEKVEVKIIKPGEHKFLCQYYNGHSTNINKSYRASWGRNNTYINRSIYVVNWCKY